MTENVNARDLLAGQRRREALKQTLDHSQHLDQMVDEHLDALDAQTRGNAPHHFQKPRSAK